MRGRDAQRGQQSEQQHRAERHHERERHRARIEHDRFDARHVHGAERAYRLHAPVREGDTRSSTADRDERALREQLPKDARPTGAERHANGQLALAGRRPGEEQVGEVRAGDEQHEPDGDEEDEKTWTHPADELPLERLDGHLDVRVGARVLALELQRDGIELRLGLDELDARPEATDHRHVG